MVKKYLVEHDGNGQMTVEIDHSILTDKDLHLLNNFWSCPEDRFLEEHGNVLHVVLKLLLELVLRVQIEGGYNTQGVISVFNWDERAGIEGWPKMDGSKGIKIIDVQGVQFLPYDMSISEVA